MRKLNYLFFLLAVPAMLTMTGCGSDDETTPEPCESATFPSTSGTATVAIKNFTTDNNSDGIIDVSARAGDFLSFAVEITKGDNRPQKLRVYQTDCINQLGDLVSFSGQPSTEDGGKRIDLRNTDDAQLRTLLYTVPTGFSTLYLNFEVDESGDKFTYKRVKLNISGSGIVDSYSNITLGGNSSSNASRLSASTGQTFTSCETATNIDYIDITYGNSLSTAKSFLTSNPARFSDFPSSPIGSNATTATKAGGAKCGDEEDTEYSVRGGKATYFKAYSGSNFNTITDAELSNVDVSTSDNQFVAVTTTPSVFAFLTSDGRKGLIRVNSGTLDDVNGSINVDVKVQR